MAHSFFTHLLVIVTASLFAAAVLWGEHYHPWGKRLIAIARGLNPESFISPEDIQLLRKEQA